MLLPTIKASSRALSSCSSASISSSSLIQSLNKGSLHDGISLSSPPTRHHSSASNAPPSAWRSLHARTPSMLAAQSRPHSARAHFHLHSTALQARCTDTSDSSASSSSSSRIMLLAAAASLVTATVVASTNSALAEEAHSSHSLPALSLPPIDVLNSNAAVSSSGSTIASAVRPGSSAISSSSVKRVPLPNPGKFDHTHRESSMLTNSQAFAGARLQFAFPCFPTPQAQAQAQGLEFNPQALSVPHIDKQLLFLPYFTFAPDGQMGMLNVKTELGHSHVLEAMIDTSSNVVGKYKYVAAPWVFKTNYRSIVQQGEDLGFEVDYKGQEFISQASVSGSASEYVLSHLQSITPQLAIGAQLHTVIPHITFCNVTAKYKTQNQEVYSASKKDGSIMLSYYRHLYEQPSTAILPGAKIDMATEFRLHQSTNKSEFAVGAVLNHPTFSYTVTGTYSPEPTIAVFLQQNFGALPFQLQFAGEMKFDGSNDSRFGIGISWG